MHEMVSPHTDHGFNMNIIVSVYEVVSYAAAMGSDECSRKDKSNVSL